MLLEEFHRGHGTALDADREIVVLNPVLYKPTGTGSFFYDLSLESTNAAVSGVWQVWDGSAYQNVTGTECAANASVWKPNVEVNAASIGKIKVDYSSTSGTPAALNYSYTLTQGGDSTKNYAGHAMGVPTTLRSQGSGTGAYTREFFLHQDRDYTFNAVKSGAGNTWKYYDGSGSWVAFANGTDTSFVGTPPVSGRVQIVFTGSGASSWSLMAHPR